MGCQLLFKFDVLTSFEHIKLISPAISQHAYLKMLEHRSASAGRIAISFSKSKGTDEAPLFEGHFMADDSKVSAFVQQIREQMISKSGHDSCGPATFTAGREMSKSQRQKWMKRALKWQSADMGFCCRA
ncbi:hypothetical protein WMY93_031007 [Mugilogobius chulae]|uniref:Uncharacterized protein n=1 Tax=Mugilogobius chulae TaxID=88201 RepID=A0AAW0ME42_9GOBI